MLKFQGPDKAVQNPLNDCFVGRGCSLHKHSVSNCWLLSIWTWDAHAVCSRVVQGLQSFIQNTHVHVATLLLTEAAQASQTFLLLSAGQS